MFERNFDAYTEGQYASWTAWSAPATMSVAEAARRVGMSEADLRTVNTIPPRMLIKAGSVLIVPRAPSKQDDVASHVADNGQLNLAPEIVTRRTTVKAGRNETVASIARRYKLAAARWRNGTTVGAARVQGRPAGRAAPWPRGAPAAVPRLAGARPRSAPPANRAAGCRSGHHRHRAKASAKRCRSRRKPRRRPEPVRCGRKSPGQVRRCPSRNQPIVLARGAYQLDGLPGHCGSTSCVTGARERRAVQL